MKRRLCDLYAGELDAWAKRRLDVGREKYGDAHLQRYNLVDVMEELLDANNIMNLLLERVCEDAEIGRRNEIIVETLGTITLVKSTMNLICAIDRLCPDYFRDDAKGGKRIWWGE